MHTLSAVEERRETVKSVDFGEVYADILRLQGKSGMKFAAVVRLLVKEGLKSDVAVALDQMGQGPGGKRSLKGGGAKSSAG